MKDYPLDTVAGIDYSLNCPAICVIPPVRDPLFLVPFMDCRWYYLTNKKKSVIENDKIHGSFFGGSGDHPRYESIASWAMEVLKENNVRSVGLENYAYSSFTNNITQIAEATGLLKYFLHTSSIPVNLYTPTSIKKCATGKGNARKDFMYEAWLEDTGVDLLAMFGKTKVASPIHDIVDSYYIACCERAENIQQSKGHPNEESNQNNQGNDSW
jgi:Holliday junction resolvasome RuvABC endonuclease subunit